MADMDDDELLNALGIDVAPAQVASRSPRDERILAGFEDILRFHQTHGRAPLHGEDRDIFERLYAVRLEQLRQLPEAQTLLADLECWLAPRHFALPRAASAFDAQGQLVDASQAAHVRGVVEQVLWAAGRLHSTA